jgi:hypothetical protein
VQGSAYLLYCLGCDGSLHSAAWMYGAADAPRDKQPGEETHVYPSIEMGVLADYSLRACQCQAEAHPNGRVADYRTDS